MSSTWHHGIKLSLFGESHGPAIGAVLDHLPPNKAIDLTQLQQMMRRRQAKSNGTTTSRIEADRPEVLSGLYRGKTTGTPLCMVIQNQNVLSNDYDHLRSIPRPGHADYTGSLRYRESNDPRGGGHFSGRLTAPLVAAGGVCGQILATCGVQAVAFLQSVHLVEDLPSDGFAESLTPAQMEEIRSLPFPMLDLQKRAAAVETILQARENTDSVGGVIRCIAIGVPAGIGSPMFAGLENLIASLVFGIPGVKGVEFGQGFESTRHFGSEHNDAFALNEGQVATCSNRHGGILGGISSGMPISFSVALKPTASIAATQHTLDLSKGEQVPLSIHGRHDPCIAARAVPVVEAVTNIALLGAFVSQQGI